MMRVAAGAKGAGGSFLRPIGSSRLIRFRVTVGNGVGTDSRCWMTAFESDSAPTEKKAIPSSSNRSCRVNVLMAMAAVVSLRPIMTMAEGRVKTPEEESLLQYHSGKACPDYGCPLFPLDIVRQAPQDRAHNQRHEAGVLESLTQIRNSSRQELFQQSGNHLTKLSSTATGDQATMTMTGFKGGPTSTQINQDRSLVVSPYYIKDQNVPHTLLGVMDGHAARGELVSEYVVTELPKLLAQRLHQALHSQDKDANSSGVMDDVISTTKRVLSEVFVDLDRTSPADPSGGCTASVILRQGDTIYIANAGDSVSMIGVYRKSTKTTRIVYASREDKPHLPEERQRVEQAGGYVYAPPQGTSRVVHVDPRTGAQVGLAMSRSIGDWAHGKLGVIPDPIVDAIHISELLDNETKRARTLASECWTVDEDGVVRKAYGKDCEDPVLVVDDFCVFAVSATDGMMDYVAKDGLMAVVAQSLFDPQGTHPATACEMLVNAAAQGWDNSRQGRYRDDIAIAMASLREPPMAAVTTSDHAGSLGKEEL